MMFVWLGRTSPTPILIQFGNNLKFGNTLPPPYQNSLDIIKWPKKTAC